MVEDIRKHDEHYAGIVCAQPTTVMKELNADRDAESEGCRCKNCVSIRACEQDTS
jgi:hypothetical protein